MLICICVKNVKFSANWHNLSIQLNDKDILISHSYLDKYFIRRLLRNWDVFCTAAAAWVKLQVQTQQDEVRFCSHCPAG